jgi:CheY-like chemotaxis protein
MTPQTKAKVMIVEDTEANIDILVETLSEHYELSVALNGEDALKLLNGYKPDLILLDVMMPLIDGYEVCRRVKADPALRDIPVIFLTALSDNSNEARGLELGAVDYIIKPFNPALVKSRVANNVTLKLYRDNLEDLVRERTLELEQANTKLATLDKVKSNFLRVISHEMRTPANGLLGLGELLFDLSPDTEEKRELWRLFDQSRSRLMRLLDNAMLLNTLESCKTDVDTDIVPVNTIINKLNGCGIPLEIVTPLDELSGTAIAGNKELMEDAVVMLLELAKAFCPGDKPVTLSVLNAKEKILLRFELPRINIAPGTEPDFFDISSTSRSGSSAEPLGLVPVVASKILSIYGGDVKILPGTERKGILEVVLPLTK